MEDLSFGIDVRGDYALFIDAGHVQDTGWMGELDDYVKNRFLNCEPTFFRLIEDGEQLSTHGWIENGEIVQWG